MNERFAWVLAAPFTAHLRRLAAETRLSWRVLALAADVPAATVHALLTGRLRRLPVAMAERLLALDPTALDRLSRSSVSAALTAQRLQRLHEHGSTWTQLARVTGLSVFETRALLDASQVSELLSLRVLAEAEAQGLVSVETARIAA